MERIFSWGILGAGDIAHRHMAPAMRNAEGHRLVAIQRQPAPSLKRMAIPGTIMPRTSCCAFPRSTLDQMGFVPKVSPVLKTMESWIFSDRLAVGAA